MAALQTTTDGLAAQEARARKARIGPNRLPSAPKQSEFVRFLRQFHNLLIYVLLGAAGLAAAIGHYTDAS
ncbi:MAG TPA: cation-transporting P-type ATPase, partial [Methyloceanibacter sp.]|nr:cation-transporting P-type ATPase [Methyloceanibacter sp.]